MGIIIEYYIEYKNKWITFYPLNRMNKEIVFNNNTHYNGCY